ncbi:MAG: nucleotidyltransferase domain-containing protein, partial [Chloroflexi bacterium]|nr:nucleotidyltransferase domain-containing protein [Chloroflexota bacterium]
YALGEETRESDIDVLIRLKLAHQRPPLGYAFFGLQEELGKILGREVDLVTEDAPSPYIRPYIEKEQVILYEER